MLKKTITILFLMTVPIFLYGQESVVHKKQLVDDQTQHRYIYPNITNLPTYRGAVVPIGVTTDYDYFSNSVVRDQIVYDATLQTPHMWNMVRPGLTGAHRDVVHSYNDGTNWINQSVVNAQSGWPQVDISLTGSAVGTVAGVLHTPSRLAIWDGSTGYIVSQFDGFTDPSLQFSGDNIFLATSGNRLQYQFYMTSDFGVSFSNYDSISTWHPTPIWWTANGGVEVGMSKSKNEQYIGHFGTNTGVGHVYDGIAEDSADNFWIINSTDAGTTWSGNDDVAKDGIINKVTGYHTPNFAPLIENFGQVDAAVDNNGTWHFTANGYGLVFNATHDTAIANSFPLLYLNSTTNQWVSVSDASIDTIQDIQTYYPTNSIGQAYPSVSVSDDGQVVFVMWTAPQLTAGGVLDTAGNGVGTPYYWRDLWFNYSVDGGTTWAGAQEFDFNVDNASECFGHASQHLEMVSPNLFRAHIVFLSDITTGVGPFDLVLTNNPINYTTYDIMTTSVDDGNLVNNFDLAQNYPNPFNPSTSIKYTLAERGNVILKVYDVLGKEVATLVNANQEQGAHEINFDASNLSSGLYIYKIQAGNFTSSKKMMLLK
jgi:hypothetical protein